MLTDDELREAIQELLTIRCDSDEEEWDRTMAVLARYSAEDVDRMNKLLKEYRPEHAERALAIR